MGSVHAAIGLGLVLSAGLWACADESDPEPAPAPKGQKRVPAARTCLPPAGHSGSPATIEDVVLLINALPKPVSVACLLETLDRPLGFDASSDTFSLQPAYGPNNPRMFIRVGDLVLTIVPKGEGRDLVEFGALLTPTRSLKAEIGFPVTEELPLSAPYDRIADVGMSTCGFCHLGETRDSRIDFAEAYVSDVLGPLPHRRVKLDYVRWAYEECDDEAEPERCAIFDALFGHGEVVFQPLAEAPVSEAE